MFRQRLKLTLARRFGPQSIRHWPSFKRACQLRNDLLHGSRDLEGLVRLLEDPILANRLTAYSAIRKYRIDEFIPHLIDALEHRSRFIERIHLYAALKTMGVVKPFKASPLGSRVLLTIDGPKNLELSCEESPSRIERAVDILISTAPIASEQLKLRGVSRHDRLRIIQSCGLQSQITQLPLLIDWLFRVDVDPGHGFAFRSALAESIGRLGFPVGGWLVQALEQEALEYEGRPGAGLGIQRPVRRNILSAFGECETNDSPHLNLILEYLSNLNGSASAGFYIESLNVLWKWRHPSLLKSALRYPRPIRQNAIGVYASYRDHLEYPLDDLDTEFWNQARAHYGSC